MAVGVCLLEVASDRESLNILIPLVQLIDSNTLVIQATFLYYKVINYLVQNYTQPDRVASAYNFAKRYAQLEFNDPNSNEEGVESINSWF